VDFDDQAFVDFAIGTVLDAPGNPPGGIIIRFIFPVSIAAALLSSAGQRLDVEFHQHFFELLRPR
jgi:hypothetical protein